MCHKWDIPNYYLTWSEYHQNNGTNIQRYCTVICKVTAEKLLGIQVGACMQNYHTLPLSYIDQFIDYSNRIINQLLDVLVCTCSIALYIYSLFLFWRTHVLHNSHKYTAILHTKTHLILKIIWIPQESVAFNDFIPCHREYSV